MTSMDLNLRAIVIGAGVGLGSSVLAGAILGIARAILLASQGLPLPKIEADLREGFGLLIVALVTGLGCSSAAGFVAARIAKRAELLHAGITGAIGVLIGVLVSADLPLWFNLASTLFVIPSSILGGYLPKRKYPELVT
jgi:hypothetical protein